MNWNYSNQFQSPVWPHYQPGPVPTGYDVQSLDQTFSVLGHGLQPNELQEQEGVR